MNAAILGVGTEITSGQILNSNAQWISEKLKKLGVETLCHLAVPDNKAIMLRSLQYIAHHDLIFITGGLGPTSDDFTREVVAQWANKKLIFDNTSFARIEERLKSRNYPVRETQKQQCHFPEDARILTNHNGTANGFFFEHLGKNIFVLPGPPTEIEGLWDDHIAQILSHLTQNIDALITESWDCVGLGESEIAHLVESVAHKCPYEKGYRLHRPYVEFKLTYRKSESFDVQKWIQAIDNILEKYLAARNGKNIIKE